MMLAARRPPDDHSARAADRVNLKDVLGQVEADGRNIHRGGSKLVLRDSTTLALRRREREPSTPSAFAEWATGLGDRHGRRADVTGWGRKRKSALERVGIESCRPLEAEIAELFAQSDRPDCGRKQNGRCQVRKRQSGRRPVAAAVR